MDTGLAVLVATSPEEKVAEAVALARAVSAGVARPQELRACGDMCSLLRLALPTRPGRSGSLLVVDQKAVPKRGSLRSRVGFSRLLHSLAHIEMSAVEIAAAQLFLYPDAPAWWRADTARVLLEEVEHFTLLCEALDSLEAKYGAWPVHDALWDTFLAGRSWMEHVVIVNRHQEAAGVDASAHLLVQMGEALHTDPKECGFLSMYLPLIERLHADEIGHVAVGSRAWHAQGRNTEEFFALVESRVRNPWGSRQPLCEPGRSAGGFTPEELQGVKERRAEFGGNGQ